MANLTITLDEDVLERARIKALEKGTSIDALMREYLERYAGADRTSAALAGFAELAESSEAGSGAHGRTWTRNELRERSPQP